MRSLSLQKACLLTNLNLCFLHRGISMMQEPRAQILVAEDSAAVAHVIERQLTAAGFAVTRGRDGMEALMLARQSNFDLVLSDEMMPRMNGCDLCRRLRNDPRYASTPIIFVSSKRFEIEAQLKSEGVATVFLGKPFSPSELVATVEEALGLAPFEPDRALIR